jgi:hypothetical protein
VKWRQRIEHFGRMIAPGPGPALTLEATASDDSISQVADIGGLKIALNDGGALAMTTQTPEQLGAGATLLNGTEATTGAVAIGYGSRARGRNSVAVGAEARTDNEDSIAIGYQATDAGLTGPVVQLGTNTKPYKWPTKAYLPQPGQALAVNASSVNEWRFPGGQYTRGQGDWMATKGVTPFYDPAFNDRGAGPKSPGRFSPTWSWFWAEWTVRPTDPTGICAPAPHTNKEPTGCRLNGMDGNVIDYNTEGGDGFVGTLPRPIGNYARAWKFGLARANVPCQMTIQIKAGAQLLNGARVLLRVSFDQGTTWAATTVIDQNYINARGGSSRDVYASVTATPGIGATSGPLAAEAAALGPLWAVFEILFDCQGSGEPILRMESIVCTGIGVAGIAPKGPTGPPGDKGAVGIQGPQGPAGADLHPRIAGGQVTFPSIAKGAAAYLGITAPWDIAGLTLSPKSGPPLPVSIRQKSGNWAEIMVYNSSPYAASNYTVQWIAVG